MKMCWKLNGLRTDDEKVKAGGVYDSKKKKAGGLVPDEPRPAGHLPSARLQPPPCVTNRKVSVATSSAQIDRT